MKNKDFKLNDLEKQFLSDEITPDLQKTKEYIEQEVDKLYRKRDVLLNRLKKYQGILNQKPLSLVLSRKYKRVKNICDKTIQKLDPIYDEMFYLENGLSFLENYLEVK